MLGHFKGMLLVGMAIYRGATLLTSTHSEEDTIPYSSAVQLRNMMVRLGRQPVEDQNRGAVKVTTLYIGTV